MNGWTKFPSVKEVTDKLLTFSDMPRVQTKKPVAPPKPGQFPAWCQTLGCGPATRTISFGLSWNFQGILNRLNQKLEDNFLLFVIRYDEALEAAKNAAAKGTPTAKQAWLAKVDEACRYAKATGMDEKNQSLLRKELLGSFLRFKNNPGMPIKNHHSHLDWHRLAMHFGMKNAACYFLKIANEPT